MTRQLISSGGPFEDIVGYSRVVRAGNHVYVSGTTSAQADGTVFGGNDAYAQAKRCFEIIEKALFAFRLEELGMSRAVIMSTFGTSSKGGL